MILNILALEAVSTLILIGFVYVCNILELGPGTG